MIGFVATLLLTRFLAPAEYGEVIAAGAAVIIATQVASIGLTAYVTVHRSPSREVFQAMSVQLGLSATSLLVLALLREPISQAVGAPGMARHVPGMALAMFITQLAQMPTATLTRALRFAVPAIARPLGEMAYVVASLSLAPLLGAQALVVGNLLRALVGTSLVLAKTPLSLWWSPCMPTLTALRRFVAFGLPLTGASIAETISSYGDNLLVSRLHGPSAMALYNLSYNVATTPTAYVANQATETLLPGMSAVPDSSRRREAFLRALGLVSVLVMPLVFGLAAVAPTMVSALLDQRWAAAAPMITVLSAVGGGYVISSVTTPYMMTLRRTGAMLALAWTRAISMIALMWTVGRLGPLWAAAAASGAVVLSTLGVLVVVCRSGGVGAAQVFGRLAPTVGSTLVMVLGVLSARTVWLAGDVSAVLGLVLEIATGAACYLGAAFLLARRQLNDVVGIVRELRARAQH